MADDIEDNGDETTNGGGIEERSPFWSGTISFGLVSVPVSLYSGRRNTKASLRMLGDDGTPLERHYCDPSTGEIVDSDEIVRGYELDDGQFVVVEDEELEALDPKQSREIDLQRFVELDDISGMYLDRPYILTPSGDTTKAYRLLAEVMEASGRAGIARFVMRGNEYLVALFAEGGVLHAQTLRFGEEIRTPEQIGLPERRSGDADRTRAFMDAIDEMSAEELSADELHTPRSERIRAAAEAKLEAGVDVVEAPTPEAEAEPEAEEEVGRERDLLETIRHRLRASEETGMPGGGDGEFADMTKSELYDRAQQHDIAGRSKMDKEELIEALRR